MIASQIAYAPRILTLLDVMNRLAKAIYFNRDQMCRLPNRAQLYSIEFGDVTKTRYKQVSSTRYKVV